MALRMRSLLIAISPVIVAAALVWQRTGHLDVRIALLILAASIALQIITNLQNDVGYTAARRRTQRNARRPAARDGASAC